MVFARSGISDPSKRSESTLAGQEKARRSLDSERRSVQYSKSNSPTNEEMKPKIVHLLEGRSAVEAEPLVQLLMRQLAHKYQFASIRIGTLSSPLEARPPSELSVQLVERRPGLDWRCSRRLAFLLQREKVDLVHAHQSAALFFGLFARLQCVQVKMLCTEHVRPHPDYPSPRRAAMNRVLLESRDRVVAASLSVRQALILNEGLLPEQVGVIYNGVPKPAYQNRADVQATRTKLGIGSNGFLILQAAPFDLWQNHSLAIQAMEQVVREIPEVRLVLVGEGPELGTIRTMVSRSNLEPYVTFLGAQPEGDSLLRAADLVLSTSIGKAVTSRLIQALAVGCPVVATRDGAVAEIVEDRVSGFLVGPGDYGALAEMIVRLGSSSALREQFGLQGRRRALRMFSEQETSDCYAKIYQAMLSR
ncbi:glycosyltransferase [Singulisphaera acidiphila DSM 18658]|uniref:Glycosyltransferase n=1 Tax=Singulisphaera acidiphila (strain ATCC BAA-1392 / DSM 18658 / VKM B-2454 / MOB10) TaxID=886293 RepID=L0DD60_SINAD|nr:glycosyltransferase [Singulisphaera acidiphila DSM 18658]